MGLLIGLIIILSAGLLYSTVVNIIVRIRNKKR